jgi:peptide deformylase
MALLKIARLGHPVLLAKATPIDDPAAPAVRRLIADMAATLADAGGVGLAAPQVHVAQRVILFSVPASRADEGEAELPVTALINPEVEPLDEEKALGWEGCLSIPGLRAAVPRWKTIRYRGLLPDGRPVERVATGFHARVVQHEVDHLDGILYPMRMDNFSLLAFDEEWRRYWMAADLQGRSA